MAASTREQVTAPTPRARVRWARPLPAPLLVALVCMVAFAVYAWPVAHNLLRHRAVFLTLTSFDTVPTSLLSVSVVRDGDFALDEFLDQLLDRYGDDVYFVTRGPEHVVSTYPLVTAVLAAPVYVVADRFGWLDNLDDIYLTARVAAAILTALTVGVLLTLFLTCTTQLRAVCLTAAMAFGTALWTTASQALWQHTSSVLLLSSALLLLVLGQTRGRLIPYVGFLLAAATIARFNNATTALALSIFVALNHRDRLGSFVVLAAVPLLLQVVYNTIYLGSPTTISYGASVGAGFTEKWWDGLSGLLLSPAKGLFFYSPFLLLALGGVVGAIRRPTSLPFFVMVACMTFVAVMSIWWAWYGGISHGNRMLTDILPLLGFLLVRSSTRWWTIGWGAFVAAAAFAVVAHAVGIFDYGACWHRVYDAPETWDTWMWNVRESPIPFYLERFGQGEFQCWQT